MTQIQGGGKTCGATIDWLIAGYAEAEGYLLITGDTREEFKGIRKTTLENLEAAVEQLLSELL
jgi:predicted nucleic acid-binding protein